MIRNLLDRYLSHWYDLLMIFAFVPHRLKTHHAWQVLHQAMPRITEAKNTTEISIKCKNLSCFFFFFVNVKNLHFHDTLKSRLLMSPYFITRNFQNPSSFFKNLRNGSSLKIEIKTSWNKVVFYKL